MPTLVFNLALLLDRLATLAPPFLYVFGAAVVALKMFPAAIGLDRGQLLVGGAAVLVVLTVADYLLQLRRPFTVEYARAWLDWKNEAGGVILSGGNVLPHRVTPSLTLRPLLRSLVLPLLFVVAALLVPERRPEEHLSGAGLERQVAALEDELAARRDELSPPDAEQLERQMEQLRELAERNPEAAAEALSALEKRLAEAEAMRLNRLAEALERAAELGEALQTPANGEASGAAPGSAAAQAVEKAEQLREALEQLIEGEGGLENMPESFQQAWTQMTESESGTASEHGEERGEQGGKETTGKQGQPGSPQSGASQTGGAMREGSVSDEQLEKMLQALESMAGKSGGNLPADDKGAGEMGSSGTDVSAPDPGSAAETARGRLEAASAALERLRDGMSQTAAMGEPGEGGVDRGRGDAPLLFGRPSRYGELGVEYAPLPPGDSGDSNMLLKRERMRPNEKLPPEEFRQPWSSGVDAPAEVRAGQGAAELGPASRRAAEHYFERLQQER